MYAVTSVPLESRTRAILRGAAFGFFGFIVLTCKQTPRFCGHPCMAGCFGFDFCGRRGLRINWLIVGMNHSWRPAIDVERSHRHIGPGSGGSHYSDKRMDARPVGGQGFCRYSDSTAATFFSTSAKSTLSSHRAASRPSRSKRNNSGGPVTFHLSCHTSALSVRRTLWKVARRATRNARAASRASTSSGGSTLTEMMVSPRRPYFSCKATTLGNFSLHGAQNVPQTSTRTTFPLRPL